MYSKVPNINEYLGDMPKPEGHIWQGTLQQLSGTPLQPADTQVTVLIY